MSESLPCWSPAPMLNDMEKTISLEDLAKHAERIARDVQTTGTVYRIKRGGRRTLVLVDIAAWRASLEIVETHPDWREDMARARRDVREGRGTSLEQLLKESGDDAPSSARRRRTAPARGAASARAAKRPRSTVGARRRSS